MNLYDTTSFQLSEQVTKNYSTSFYSATRMFDNNMRMAIFSIYGFVRYADEIVDTFHEFDKKSLLESFENDYYQAYKKGISLNPILHSFQLTVKKFNLSDSHIQSFLRSMKMDLDKRKYTTSAEINEYIYGSANVVGLMCLKVFCNGDDMLYRELEEPAARLGSAFQKVNFLRDLKSDIENLDRNYFPATTKDGFTEQEKLKIVEDIENDFKQALCGIKKLPKNSRFPVTVAYFYYLSLLAKIKNTPATRIIAKRIRISNTTKINIMVKSFVVNKLNLI